MAHMPFGKYKDQHLSEVPTSYLEWLTHECGALKPWLRSQISAEIDRRCNEVGPEKNYGVTHAALVSHLERALLVAYKRTALIIHPDKPGGSNEGMRALNIFVDALKKELKKALED